MFTFYRGALLSIPERHPGRTLTAIGIVFGLAYGIAVVALPKVNRRIVIGDAEGHYVQLRSAVFDRDLDFRNDYAGLEGLTVGSEIESSIAAAKATPTGYQRNFMPVGPAIVWAPAFLLVTAIVWLVDVFGAGYPLDGFAPVFQVSAGLSGIAAATLGSWFAFQAAALLFDRRTAIWATLAVWLSSSAVYYSLVSPTYSHAASMFAAGAFWLFWIRTLDRQTPARYAAVGALAGFAALMRWQDVMLLVVPVLEILWQRRHLRLAIMAARIATCVVSFAVTFSPQMVVWHALYGRAFTIPQGAAFMHWGQPAVLAVLFSYKHGLFTWSPIIAVAVAGFVPLFRNHRLLGTAAITFVVVTCYVNGAVADWWGGEAFGARRFLSCYTLFVLGLAALQHQCRLRTGGLAAVAMVFAVYTGLLLVQYEAFMHGLRQLVPYPDRFVSLWLWRFRAPFDLLQWWLRR